MVSSSVYDDWDPPAATTLYCRVQGISWSTFKYNLARGHAPSKLRQIEYDLELHKYKCRNCSYLLMGDQCTRVGAVEVNSICKSYTPQPGMPTSKRTGKKASGQRKKSKKKKGTKGGTGKRKMKK